MKQFHKCFPLSLSVSRHSADKVWWLALLYYDQWKTLSILHYLTSKFVFFEMGEPQEQVWYDSHVTAPPSSALKALSDVYLWFQIVSTAQLVPCREPSNWSEPVCGSSRCGPLRVSLVFDPPPPSSSSALRRSAHPAHQRDCPAALPAHSDHTNLKYISTGNIIEPESTSLIFFVSQFPLVSLYLILTLNLLKMFLRKTHNESAILSGKFTGTLSHI